MHQRASRSTSINASPTCPSTPKTSIPHRSTTFRQRTALRRALCRRLAAGHTEIQRHHPRHTQKRDRLDLTPLPQRCSCRQARRRHWQLRRCCGGACPHEDTRETACIAGANLLNNVTLSVLHGATPFADTPAACDDKIATAITAILATLADATNATKPHGSLMCTEPKTAAPPPVRWSRHLARRKFHYHPQYRAKTTCVDFSR
jgi:hypothetical protein